MSYSLLMDYPSSFKVTWSIFVSYFISLVSWVVFARQAVPCVPQQTNSYYLVPQHLGHTYSSRKIKRQLFFQFHYILSTIFCLFCQLFNYIFIRRLCIIYLCLRVHRQWTLLIHYEIWGSHWTLHLSINTSLLRNY